MQLPIYHKITVGIFIDDDGLFEEKKLKPEDREFMEHLFRKTSFA